MVRLRLRSITVAWEDSACNKKLHSWKTQVVDVARLSLKILAIAWQSSAKLTVLLLLLLVVSSSFPVISAGLLTRLVNDVVTMLKVGNSLENTTVLLGISYLICQILPFIFMPATESIRGRLSDLLTAEMDKKVMKKASQLTGMGYFDESQFYNKLQFIQENTILPEATLWLMLSTLNHGIILISLLILMTTISPLIPFAMLLVAVPHLWVEYHHHKQAYDMTWEQMPESRQLAYYHQLLVDTKSAKEIKFFNVGAYFITRYREVFDAVFKKVRLLKISHTKSTMLFSLLHGIGLALLYAYVVLISVQGAITVGDLAMYFSVVASMQQNFWMLTLMAGQLIGSTAGLRSLWSFFELAPVLKTVESPQYFYQISRAIEFRNVSFSYPGRKQSVFKNISFSIETGETLAIVGENSAGKTTLVKLLCRFYDPTEGQIFIDDIPLHQYHLESLRQKIAPVFQDFSRFFLTVGENIGIGNVDQVSNEASIIQAAEKGQADTVVSQLLEGYQTLLGRQFEGGADLSGGEWQKIAISRAFMGDPQLLILDEPTAALDAESEYTLFQRFKMLTQGVTTLLISHRFSTVHMADRILVIDQGEVLEDGTHAQLMKKEGRYATLYRMQSEKYQ